MKGARGVLINITGGSDMTLFEVDEAANRIGDEVDSDANIIFGSTMDPSLEGKLRVSVVATGIEADAVAKPRPVLKVYSRPTPPDDDGGEEIPIPENAPVAEAEIAPSLLPIADHEPLVAEPFEGPDPAAAAPDAAQIEAAAPVAAPAPPRPAMAPDAFMPKPPVDPRGGHDPVVQPDPFGEADMINGGAGVAAKKRGPSLFRRMTGIARVRREETPPPAIVPEETSIVAPPASPAPPAPPAPPIIAEPAAPAMEEAELPKPVIPDSPKPIVTEPARPVAAPAPQQAKLDSFERTEHHGSSQSEEDLLDIPAFLRRQAN